MIYVITDLINASDSILRVFHKLEALLASLGYRSTYQLYTSSQLASKETNLEGIHFFLCYTPYDLEIRKNSTAYKLSAQYNIPLFDRGDYFSNTLFIEDVMAYTLSYCNKKDF